MSTDQTPETDDQKTQKIRQEGELNDDQIGGASGGTQQHFPPGRFPAGNPGHAPGQSNDPGNSGK